MRLISGTLRSTPLPWLPVLSNIELSALRRKAATDKLVEKIVKHDSLPIQPAEGNGDLQTCVLVARPRRCLTLSNFVPWQNWMAAYLGYTLRMRTLFRGWPIMVNDTHTRRRRRRISESAVVRDQIFDKKSRKCVANPHKLVENLAAKLVEKQVCSWLE